MNDREIYSDDSLVEPLTRREREILTYLNEGFSAPEIAEQLNLAVSSVKWHQQQLYGKLGVNSKRQALIRARQLGLLDTPLPPAGQKSPAAPPRHNLPLQVTRFFGREAEISQLQTRLAEHRLVTLTGSGGVGKTRLSLAAAEALLPDFADGVWQAELAPLTDPALVPQQVAASLGVRDEPGQQMVDTLTLYLRERQALLVLDNCEHLLAACAQLAGALLRACPRVRLLATSREPLGVAGEAVFAVPSLNFPDPEHLPPLDQLTDYVAIRLFLDRARLVLPDYQVTAGNAAALARICQRLDGIPLALEMAASRLRLLNAEALAARLDGIFRVLTGGSRSALPRQQTLRATLDWTYNLLSPEERRLFQRLSVFAGGFTLEAAEAVGAGEGLAADQILEWLAALVEKSLVVAARKPDQDTRYRLLEIMRQYAREKLNDAGEAERLHTRHRDYFLLFFETNVSKLDTVERPMWMRRLATDRDNLRQALAWSFDDTNNVEAGPRLLIACILLRGTPVWPSLVEYEAWCHRGVAWCQSHDGVSARLFARLLTRASDVMIFSDQQLALGWSKKAVEILRALGPAGRQTLGDSLTTLGVRYWESDEPELAAAAHAEAQALMDETEADNSTAQTKVGAWAAMSQASLAEEQGNYQEAKRLLDESLKHLTGNENYWTLFFSLKGLGGICLALREYEEARQHFHAAQLVANTMEDAWAMNVASTSLAELELQRGNLQTALDHCRVALALALEAHDGFAFALGLAVVAGVRAAQGQAARAARVAGAAQGVWVRRGRKPSQVPSFSLDTLLPGWRDGPDAATISAAFEAGQSMSVDEAMNFALTEPSDE